MSLNTTISYAIRNYPMLFKSRMEFLSYLFFCYGTGYEWINGELVCERRTQFSLSDNSANNLLAMRLIYPLHDDKPLPKIAKDVYSDAIDALLVQHKDTLNRIVKGEIELRKPKVNSYIEHATYYSPIFTIPSDIKLEYYGAAVETCEYFSKHSKLCKFLTDNLQKNSWTSKEYSSNWSSLAEKSSAFIKAKKLKLVT